MKVNYKKIGVVLTSVVGGFYVLFLALPLVLTPVVNKYIPQVEKIVTDSGFDLKLEQIKVTTGFDLTAGIKVKEISISTQDNDNIFVGKNLQGNIKLLSLLKKKIRFGKFSADSVNSNIILDKNGGPVILEKLTTQNKDSENISSEPVTMPFGLKLSNHLPNIYINNYKISAIDYENKLYSIDGENFKITDFILDKKIKFSTKGKVVLDGNVISNYNVKIYNKIMPELVLDDLVFPKEIVQQAEDEPFNIDFNIIDIFKLINKNKLHADLNADIKVSGTFKEPVQNGYFSIENLSVLDLPQSYAKLAFKGYKTDIDSIFYTSSDKKENTQIIGNIKNGKKKSIDLTLRSNAKFNNVIRLIDTIAQSVGINDLKTLSATGGVDADFNINSDLKTVNSTGYLKINPSSFKYGLYNVSVENVTADIDMTNNNINIKNCGFSILGHTLKLIGSITKDAIADLKLSGDNLSIKSLLVTAGMGDLLKENNINKGTLSISALVKGKLTDIKPDILLSIDNLDVYNVPAALKLSVPCAKLIADMDKITIKNTYALIDKYRIDVSGVINDYLKDKLNLKLSGSINNSHKMTLSGIVTNLSNPKLDLNLSVPENISIPVPYMPNSNVTFSGNLNIKGGVESPKLSGKVLMPDLSIKDMNFALQNTVLNFDGAAIKGDASVKSFKFDNIIGSDISSKFELANFNVFKLKDINSVFWNGKITGDITYNISTTAVGVDLSGKGLNSESAVYATTSIAKALTGTLDFSAKLTTSGVTDIDMIKNMKGDIDFSIKDGRFVSIGKLENIVQAQNITSINLLKSAVSALSTLSAVQQTDKFDTISGNLTMSNGMANISNIKVIGPLMSYFVKGSYNIIPNSANLVILGRLDSKTVAVLGPLGQLSADKLLSYIPKIGALTAQYLNQLTSDPKNEDTSVIPGLSTGSKDYKDFKVIFNGPADKASSMKSFKWLSKCDTTKMNVKDDVQNAAKAVKENINSQVESAKNSANALKTNVTNTINTTKQQAKQQVTDVKQTVEDVKNIKNNASQSAKNIGELLKNAALNANKKVETPNQNPQPNTVETPKEDANSVSE